MMKTRLRKISLFLALPLLAGVIAFTPTDNYFEISKNLEIFTNLYKQLNIYYVDETKPGDLMKTGIDAMLESLDPYTVYYPESKIEDYRFMTTGQYGGIGALINTIDGNVTIMEPYEDYAAYEAGLKAGDIIRKIDGREVDGLESDQISTLLKGQAGTEVTVDIERPGTESITTYKVERQDVQIPDIPYYGMLDEVTGYIHLRSFTKTASAEVKRALVDLEKNKGMTQLIFDLRGNGGGLLREAINIVNIFVPKGTEIVSTRGKLDEWNKTHNALAEPLAPDLPLVVLVDGSSASASEIVSGALQDLDRAVILGTSTFGKGLVQQTKDISYNTKLKLTVAKYYIPSGRCIQKLDYSHREDGYVDEVPDSLIQEFRTTGGRKVFDGRGIRPDIEVGQEDLSNILSGLMQNHVVFHYATEFARSNDEISEPEEFDLGENYDAFVEFALQSDFNYNTRTEQVMKNLRKIAETERYYQGAEDAFAQLEAELAPEKSRDLYKFQDQIEFTLEEEIVSRYHYQEGAIRYGLRHDPVLRRATDIFEGEYEQVLSPAAPQD